LVFLSHIIFLVDVTFYYAKIIFLVLNGIFLAFSSYFLIPELINIFEELSWFGLLYEMVSFLPIGIII